MRLAAEALARIAGNKDVSLYERGDARRLVQALQDKGNKSATVRRRVQSLHALLELGYLEKDETKRNPFARLSIPGEGCDTRKRGVFSEDQLRALYSEALTLQKDTRLILPILGETGARLAEIVGLRWADIDMEDWGLSINPHELRRLKTTGSERKIPLVGAAKSALRLLHKGRSCEIYVFPRWRRSDGFVATHASNALNKYLSQKTPGLTCHCFRHAFRDRLRNVGAPVDLIDQIGGWSSTRHVGCSIRVWLRDGCSAQLSRENKDMPLDPYPNVRFLPIRTIAELWYRDSIGVPSEVIESELRRAHINLAPGRDWAVDGLVPEDDMPSLDDLPSAEVSISREFVRRFSQKQRWPHPRFWFPGEARPTRRSGRPTHIPEIIEE